MEKVCGRQVEQGGQLPFQDLLLNRTENGGLKLQIYRKPTHTDQYQNFSSHHPTEHKLSVVRTLLERSQCLITKIEDRKQEDYHVEEALRAFGYPKWTFNKVRRQIESKRDKKTRQERNTSQRQIFVISYVENVSVAVARIMRKHNVPMAMKSYKILKSVLVHTKRQTGEGRLNRMYVQSSLRQL